MFVKKSRYDKLKQDHNMLHQCYIELCREISKTELGKNNIYKVGDSYLINDMSHNDYYRWAYKTNKRLYPIKSVQIVGFSPTNTHILISFKNVDKYEWYNIEHFNFMVIEKLG